MIKNKNGDIVSKISNFKKGINNVNCHYQALFLLLSKDLSHDTPAECDTQAKEGKYDLVLYTRINGVVSKVAGPVELEVEKLEVERCKTL